MECFVLLESKANPPADSTVFEKFAELASRNLNANLGWLGWLNLSDPDGFFLARLNMDQLRYQTASVKMSLEKLVLTRWLEANEPSAEVLSSMEGGDL
jgi:hypothetical protein